MVPKDFIAMIAEDARKLQKSFGIFASVTIAQACLETGYGKSQPVDKYTGKKSYNLFGVKGEGTKGHVTCSTWEVVNGKKITIDASFRAYNNYLESLEDHNKVLLLARYKPVRDAKNGADAVMQLHPCGYATDPDYGAKLVSIQKTYNLYQYDTPLVEITKPVEVAIPKEKDEGDEPMKLEQWEKDLIVDGVKKFSKATGADGKVIINSPDVWIAKVNDGTLTAKELAVLNFAITIRTTK